MKKLQIINIKEKTINTLRIFFILFTLFNVSYKFIPMNIPTTYLSIGIFFIIFVYHTCKEKKILFYNISSLIFCALFILSSGISYISNVNAPDAYMIRMSIVYFLIILLTPTIFQLIFNGNNLLTLKTIGYSGFINALFIILMFIIPSFQSFYLSFINSNTIDLTGIDALENAMSLRMVGITGFSVYSAGFMQILCAISFTTYLFYKNKKRLKPTIFESLILFTILLSSIITARSSIIGIIVFISILLKLTNIFQFVKITIFSIITIILSLTAIITFLPPNFQIFFLHWLTELFQSGEKTGSLQANISMFKYSFEHFSLVGDSRWYGNNNDYYMNIDVGWYRMLFSVGYIGFIFWSLTIISTLRLKNIFSLKITNENWILLSLLIYFFIMNFKGAILFDSFQFLFIIIAFNLAFSSKKDGAYNALKKE